jgi:RHS repeat-associated protein
MQMPNRQSSLIAGDEHRYGFQGQEMDDEIKGHGNSVNYKYRMHDPRVGRFFAVDPLAPEYPHNGPYNFSENRVIDGLELEGLEVVTKSSASTASLGASGFNETGMMLDYSGTEIKVYSYTTYGFGAETNISLGVDWLSGYYPDATANDLKGDGKVNVLSGGEVATLTTSEAITANGKRGTIIGGGIGISVLPVSGAVYETETTIKEVEFNPSEWTKVIPKINHVIRSLYTSISEIQEETIHHSRIGIERNKVEWNRLYQLRKTTDAGSSKDEDLKFKMKIMELSIEDHENKIEKGKAAIGLIKEQIKGLNNVKEQIKDEQ